MIYGYARVSSDGQSVAAQVETLSAAGAVKTYREVGKGWRNNRPQLLKLLDALEESDTLLITRLDRLARSTRDLLNMLATIAEKGTGFRSLADPWADTTTPHGRLILTMLGGLAEFESELIRARTSEGRQRAMKRGVRFGRKLKLSEEARREILARKERGEHNTEIARLFGVHNSTISRLRP